MLKTMVKPKWLALLGGALLVVVLFLLLGRWQLNAAFDSSTTAVDSEQYEEVVPLGELIQPGGGVTEETVARSITMSGWLVPGDFTIVSNRIQNGETGWWVVGHLAVADDGVSEFLPSSPVVTEETETGTASEYPGLVVAFGWAATEDEALAAAAELNASTPQIAEQAAPLNIVGKLEALQEPVIDRDGQNPAQVNSMSAGQLINTWQAPAVSYYAAWSLVETGVELPAGLQPIAVVAIDDSFQLDLLNIFYAIEWLVFAIMAIYIWWRLVRDDYQAELAEDPVADLAEEIRREKLRALAAERAPQDKPAPERN
ncbi:SURF1 family cytochrome oxidase biogenesis protein [Gulosibacter chungangensis]|uniref:SURF1-like protein n=1 Tax=Gulosibacter chungangensis TaxID=979746 RepID=A0A7J5B8H2_9MICO|nr:SURF1 family cytochrome oxidase biogenesis protein [Gulosibacter chungangensis]KAB1641657.1 hypothetical protein F8O05_11940 [Gulosibacter chungangensis]